MQTYVNLNWSIHAEIRGQCPSYLQHSTAGRPISATTSSRCSELAFQNATRKLSGGPDQKAGWRWVSVAAAVGSVCGGFSRQENKKCAAPLPNTCIRPSEAAADHGTFSDTSPRALSFGPCQSRFRKVGSNTSEKTIHPPSNIVVVFEQLVEFWTHILGSMDASQQLQAPPASAASRANAGATAPHPTYPQMAGIYVGDVNKSIIANTVQNSQDISFGNLISCWRNCSRGPHSLTMLQSQLREEELGAQGGGLTNPL
jgi:hypothetical protein